MEKNFASQKKYYHPEIWGNTGYGLDCAHRSLQVQELTGLDINFGIVLVHKKHHTIADTCGVLSNYCLAYAWHVWNENDDTIFDMVESMNSLGYKIPQNPKIKIFDSPQNIKTHKQWILWLKNKCLNLSFNQNADIIYIQGIGLDDSYKVLHQDDFNNMLDKIDQKFSITAKTQNMVVKMV